VTRVVAVVSFRREPYLEDAVVVVGLDVLDEHVAGDPKLVVDAAAVRPTPVVGLVGRVDGQDAVVEPQVDLLGLEPRQVRVDDETSSSDSSWRFERPKPARACPSIMERRIWSNRRSISSKGVILIMNLTTVEGCSEEINIAGTVIARSRRTAKPTGRRPTGRQRNPLGVPRERRRVLPSLPDFAPGAWRYARVPLVLAVPAAFLAPPVGLGCLLAAAGALWFHRDPPRSPPPSGVVAPADGRVSIVREEGDRVRVGVFMNVTDVHVNRAPAAGTVRSVEHAPGRHLPAFTKESDRNERVEIDCGDYELTLVAGAVARRVHPYVEAGDDLARGDRIGHISFGSRADVLLPADYDREDVRVSKGQHVRAAETVIVA
jgi:phosphatidylserine decarboxylase